LPELVYARSNGLLLIQKQEPRGTRQKKLQNLDPMHLSGFGGIWCFHDTGFIARSFIVFDRMHEG
jgi:hypothetical protein